MSGGRQTGTVPKTKHNTRVRRENAVNHIPNNLDWHESYHPQRGRKESNTSAPRHPDTGDDIFEENPWLGLTPPQHRTQDNHHRGDDELRWTNVKSSNLTPERSSTLANVETYIAGNRSTMLHQDNGPEDRETSINKELARGRIKLRMEQSQRKIEELQQQQAALLSLRNKSIQQVKPVQIEELNQQPGPLMSLRNKAIQQVKPVQQEEVDRATNLEGRLQEYANIMQALERDETSNLEEGQAEQQVWKKMNDLFTKRAQADSLLAYLESENIGDGAPSISSDDGEVAVFTRGLASGDGEDIGRRDVTKQDNREQATAAYLHMKELKLEEVKTKLEQLQNLLTKVERIREARPPQRVNGETASHCSEPPSHTQVKNCPSNNSVLDKLHSKKFDLENPVRKVKSNPSGSVSQSSVYNQPQADSWSYPGLSNSQTFHQNTADYSSDEVEADYDESPVKLCSSGPQSHLPPNVLLKSRVQEPTVNGPHSAVKHSSAGNIARTDSRPCTLHPEVDDVARQSQHLSHLDLGAAQTNNSAALALQISQLQLQMEQMQLICQNMLEKQHVNVFPTPHSCSLLPPNSMGFMQCLSPTTQWHQHQLLVNSLNQCCQLIWHQQRELAGLRQALTMLQEEGSVYKCPSAGYGNNLNFDPGLLWPQPPQTLNNQVPPGNRANNYWDNFRSYSRQNLLSGRNKSNEGCLPDRIRVSRPSPQNENLCPKENRCEIRGNSARCRQPTIQLSNGGCLREQNVRRYGRFNPSNILKHDIPDMASLEQSVFSELESVMTESERSPEMLLQLLSQLRSLKSHQQVLDNNLMNDCELLDPGTPVYSRIEHRRNQGTPLSYDHDTPKLESVLEEVGRIIQECEVCSPELLQQVVGLVIRAFHFPPQHDAVSRLEASLLKFQGSRINQVGDELLCVIASVISAHITPMLNATHGVEEVESALVEQIEEGAVGGLPLPSSQHSTSQSVETELAEADQPQHNVDNSEVFDLLDEGILPNMEVLDNQETPPREENAEQPLVET